MKLIKYFSLGLLFIIISPNLVLASTFVGPWTKTSSIEVPTGGQVTFSYNGYLYVLGGSADDVTPNRLYSKQLADGNMSSWLALTSSSEILYRQSGVSKNERFYILGGHYWPANYSANLVYGGKFETNGDVLGWNLETNLLPKALAQGSSAIVGDWIYYAGGFTDYPRNGNNIVYKAKINADGSLGEWSSAGEMSNALSQFGLSTFENNLIFIGGEICATGQVISTVKSAQIDLLTGNILSWRSLLSLPRASKLHSVTKVGNGILVIGGNNPSGNLDNILYAQFNKDDILGPWQENDTRFPWQIATHAAAVVGNYVYVIGGFAVGSDIYGATNAVWKAQLGPDIFPKVPIIIIPGIGASFNKVLFHLGTFAPNEEWTIAPYVKNYDELVASLKDPIVYNYDWRKPVNDNALELKKYLDNKNINEVEIIGHSMGGLIGARFGSLYPEKLKKLTTLGSPFGGSTKAYRVWEGADLSDFSGWEKIGIQLFLEANAGKFDSDVQAVQKEVTSMQNLLPTYKYLQKENGNWIPNERIRWTNNFWSHLSDDLNNIAAKTVNTFGDGIDTEGTYVVKNRSILDQILGRWEDGKPVKTEMKSGDGTVLTGAAKFTGATEDNVGAVDHGDLPSRMIFPKYDNALVMAIASPATFEVTPPSGPVLYPENSILAINEPMEGPYKVKIEPVGGGGKFTFYFGRISKNDQAWDDFSGSISSGELEKNYNFDKTKNMGADPIERAVGRLKNIEKAMETASINSGEIQVFENVINNLEQEILTLSTLDENRQAAIIRTALQKVKQVQTAWNQTDSEFTELVVYNLRRLTRDVLEAMGNI